MLARAAGTLHAEICGVPVSVRRYPYRLLEQPEALADLALPVAKAEDLICMKLSAISNRGAKRDFWDLLAMLEHRKIALDDALILYRQKYPVEDVGHVVRSLVYFGDADIEPMPAGLDFDQWERIKTAFRKSVTELP